MILEKDFGTIKLNNKDYSVSTSKHSHEPRGSGSSIPRFNYTKTKLHKILKEFEKELTSKGRIGLIWKHQNYYKGLLVNVDDKIITIITSIISKKNNSSDKLFKNITRAVIDKEI